MVSSSFLQHRSYGVHYHDPDKTPPAKYRVDFCISVEQNIPPNPQGIINKIIPGGRCAVVRLFGARENLSSGFYLREVWLPKAVSP
jgi:AraC family transcriptional regulator